MAKIKEEIVVLKFSKLVKDGSGDDLSVTDDVIAALEQVAQELAGDHVIVELERAT